MIHRAMRWIPTMTPRRMRQLWYAPVLTLAMVLMLIRTLAMARLLDVRAFAEFSGGMLVSGSFCMLGCMGLHQMLQREWPLRLVHGRELQALVRAAQCNLVAVGCCLVGLLGVAFGLSFAGMSPGLLAVGLLHGLSHQFFLVATVESRSRGDALRFSYQNLIRAVIVLGPGIAAAVWTGSALTVLAIDALVTFALSLGYFQKVVGRTNHGVLLAYLIGLRGLRRVRWHSARTLMSVSVVSFVLLNLDRWIASDLLGVVGFAGYSFAWIVLSVAQSAQSLINASIYPLIARRFAAHGCDVAFDVCVRGSAVIVLAGAILALPFGYLYELGVRRWYPQYSDTIALLPLFLAIAVLRVSDFWSSFLLIAGFEGRLLKLHIAAATLSTITWLALVQPWKAGSLTLGQVAWLATVLTASAYAMAAIAAWLARREMKRALLP